MRKLMRRNADWEDRADRFVFAYVGHLGEGHAVKIGIESLRSAPNLKMELRRGGVHAGFSGTAGGIRTGIQNDNAQLHFIDFSISVCI